MINTFDQSIQYPARDPLNIAVLGAGNMGARMVRVLKKIPGIRIKFIYSRTLGNAQRLSLDCGAISTDQIDEVFAYREVPVVFDCLPTFTRLNTLQKCVANNKHVFCEKPLALNRSMAEGIQDCLSKYSKIVMVGQVLRFFWEYSKLREMVMTGEIGQVGTIRLSRCVGFPGADSWFGHPEKSGGVILDLMIHDLDFLRWICGEAKTVYARSITKDSVGADYALATLQMQSGVIAHVEGSWAHPVGSFRQTVEICGSRGMLAYDNTAATGFQWMSTSREENKKTSRISLPLTNPGNDPYYAEVQHFFECVRQGRSPAISWGDALNSCELAFSALESAYTGQPVQPIIRNGQIGN